MKVLTGKAAPAGGDTGGDGDSGTGDTDGDTGTANSSDSDVKDTSANALASTGANLAMLGVALLLALLGCLAIAANRIRRKNEE